MSFQEMWPREGCEACAPNFALQRAGLWAHRHAGASPLGAVTDDVGFASSLFSAMAGTLEEVRRHPLPVHNCLLISCFVSAVATRARDVTTQSSKERQPRVGRAVGAMTPVLSKLIIHRPDSACNLRLDFSATKGRTHKDWFPVLFLSSKWQQ